MPKKKAKKKRIRKSKGTPARVRVLLVSMVLAVAAGIVLVKFFQTTRGKVVLMDTGFVGYYAEIQQDVDKNLRRVLAESGLRRSLEEGRSTEIARGRRLLAYDWRVTCDPPCNFIDMNLKITRAVRRAGAVVRSSVERREDSKSPDQALVFNIGSRRYTTHRITIERRTPTAGVTRTKGDIRATPRGTRRPRAVLVVDDFGYAKSELVEAFFTYELPITISVIPSLQHSRYSISRARANGKEPILHLPMEAEQGPVSDVAAVLTAMSDDEIRALVTRYLTGNPGVVGVNNHMGSKATQDRRVMTTVLSVIKLRRLFFLDSLTSGKSIAYTTARDMGVPAARNGIFLDDVDDVLVIEEQLLRLLEIAREHGSAVAIGHPRPKTYEVLKRNLEVLKDSGVEFVFLSEVVD